MGKYKYTAEYEINASVKMLYPYISTPTGLAQWFADDVKVNQDKTYDIVWDGRSHPAKIVSLRTNSSVKYQFLPDKKDETGDPSYLEFRLSHNEMTETAFLKIIDYSEMDNEHDLKELWNNLISQLREIVRG